MDIDIIELEPHCEDAYEAFVLEHPHSLLNHSLRYRDFLMELLHCRARYGLAVRAGGVVGVMPLMERGGPYGVVLNSLPYFGSCGGLLASDDVARMALTRWYGEEATRAGVAASTVIENPLALPAPAMPHHVFDERMSHITRLEGSASMKGDLSTVISGSARRNVRKALNSGVSVATDNYAFDVLEEIHGIGMTAIGGLAKSHEFFAAVPRCFRPGADYNLYVARIEGAVVAALLVFYYRETIEYWVPATRLEYRQLQPMAAILQQAMTEGMERNVGLWNWGGSRLNQENLMRFKAKWGGQSQRYRYWVTVNNQDLFSADAAELLGAYPGFYVVPFPLLTRERGFAVLPAEGDVGKGPAQCADS